MSMAEVAKLAGVSYATVSRVINGRSDVSSKSTQLVRDAMQRIGYIPPARRRGPKPRASGVRTGNIGVLFIGEAPTLATSPISAFVLHAIEQAAAAQGFGVMLGQVTAAGGLPQSVVNGQVDGLLMHGQPPSSDIRQQLSRYSACVWLLCQRTQLGYWGDRVSPDNYQIGTLACHYLLDRGHRRIAAVHCDLSHMGFVARARGCEDAAREMGVPCTMLADEQAIFGRDGPSTREAAQYDALIDQLLSSDGPRPTGLFIPRDALTIQMYRALRRRGIQPGRDIEIVSCDNIPALDALDPRPTTIDVRPEEIGRRAVEKLIGRINQRETPMNLTSLVEPRLVPGDEATHAGSGGTSRHPAALRHAGA
jgi:LacI family transcriptional regulator